MTAEVERHVHALASGLSVLDAFRGDEALTLAELHSRTELTRSRILRIAGTLIVNGYLDYNAKTKSYRLGLKLFRFGQSLSNRFRSLSDFVRPSLERLANESGDTAFYSIVRGEERLVVAKAESHEGIRFFVEEGQTRPLYRGATGKVLLSYQTRDFVQQMIQNLSPDATENGFDTLLEDLSRVRKVGFCESRGEVTPFGFAIAVPLRTIREDAEHIDAITIAGPLAKFDDDVAKRSLDLLLREKSNLEKLF